MSLFFLKRGEEAARKLKALNFPLYVRHSGALDRELVAWRLDEYSAEKFSGEERISAYVMMMLVRFLWKSRV